MKNILPFLIMLATFNAFACKCLNIDYDEALLKSEEVVLVKVTSTTLLEVPEDSQGRVRVNYTIIDSLKLLNDSPQFILEGLDSCSIGMVAGRQYFLFIRKNRLVHYCDGSSFVPYWVKSAKEAFEGVKKYGTN